MTHPVLTGALLWSAVLVALAAGVGIVVMSGAAARLHFVTAAGLLAPPLVMAAVLCEAGLSQAGVKAILITLVLMIQGPAVAHILGRAIYSHERLPETGKEERG